jgi:hypothetical protein
MVRRFELLGRAREARAWIIEDDYASECRCLPHAATVDVPDQGMHLNIYLSGLRAIHIESRARQEDRAFNEPTVQSCAAPIGFDAGVRRISAADPCSGGATAGEADDRGVAIFAVEGHNRACEAIDPL